MNINSLELLHKYGYYAQRSAFLLITQHQGTEFCSRSVNRVGRCTSQSLLQPVIG